MFIKSSNKKKALQKKDICVSESRMTHCIGGKKTWRIASDLGNLRLLFIRKEKH